MKKSRWIGLWLIALLFILGVFVISPEAEAAGEQMQTVQITAYQYYQYAFDLLDQVNQFRKGNVRPELKMDKDLMDAAIQRAAECSFYRDDSHTRPSGKAFSSVNKKACAENYFIGSIGESSDPDNLEEWWDKPDIVLNDWRRMGTPDGGYGPNGENLNNRKYVTAGIGVVRINNDVYWVMLFGDSVDENAVVSRSDYNTDTRVLKYPKIQVAQTYLNKKTIVINPSPTIPKTLKVGKTANINLNIAQSDSIYYYATLLKSKLVFTSSDPDVATVSTKGVITGKKAGTATITVRSKLSNSSAPVLRTFTLTVTDSSSQKDTGIPKIISQPQNTSVIVGNNASFILEASGEGLVYQWYYRKSESSSWKAITAERGKKATYTVQTKLYQDGYQYRCEVKNSKGTVYSNVVTLNVTKAAAKPKIITQPPEAVSVLAGEKATFSIKAEGADLSYQWYFRTSSKGTWKKTNLSAGTEDTYVLTAKLKQNGYQYRCKVSNSAGTVYSKALTLKVSNTAVKPKIVSQPPKSLSASVGKKVTFSVKAEGENLTYQWYFRTASGSWKVVNMADGTKSTYSFTPKIKQNGNQYRCKVSNGAGYVYSSILTLKVQ